jgi:rhodanese-related sulfurtransferase
MKTVNKSQLKQWLDTKEDMLLINVLPQEDFQKQSIPGSINIPFKGTDNFAVEVGERAKSKGQHIVVYCRNTQCDASRNAAAELETAGFTNVQAFEAGVEGWFGTAQPAAA